MSIITSSTVHFGNPQQRLNFQNHAGIPSIPRCEMCMCRSTYPFLIFQLLLRQVLIRFLQEVRTCRKQDFLFKIVLINSIVLILHTTTKQGLDIKCCMQFRTVSLLQTFVSSTMCFNYRLIK